jgi:hypothetical protein
MHAPFTFFLEELSRFMLTSGQFVTDTRNALRIYQFQTSLISDSIQLVPARFQLSIFETMLCVLIRVGHASNAT